MSIFAPGFPEEPVDERAQLALIASRPNNQAYGPEDRAYLLSLIREKQTEIDESDELLIKHGEILHRIANALNGEPTSLSSWSHHDLGDKTEALAKLASKQTEAFLKIEDILDNHSFGYDVDAPTVVEADLVRNVLASTKDD